MFPSIIFQIGVVLEFDPWMSLHVQSSDVIIGYAADNDLRKLIDTAEHATDKCKQIFAIHKPAKVSNQAKSWFNKSTKQARCMMMFFQDR